MKHYQRISMPLLGSSLALALLALAGLPTTTLAQKGAEKLMRLRPVQTEKGLQASEPADRAGMSCPKCKDSWVTVVEKTFKAVQPEIQRQVLRHGCPGCANTIVTKGHGKAKTSKVVHVCKDCGSQDASCCAAGKGSGPTPGMEQK